VCGFDFLTCERFLYEFVSFNYWLDVRVGSLIKRRVFLSSPFFSSRCFWLVDAKLINRVNSLSVGDINSLPTDELRFLVDVVCSDDYLFDEGVAWALIKELRCRERSMVSLEPKETCMAKKGF